MIFFKIDGQECTRLGVFIACIQRDVQKMCQSMMFMLSQNRGRKTHKAINFPFFNTVKEASYFLSNRDDPSKRLGIQM